MPTEGHCRRGEAEGSGRSTEIRPNDLLSSTRVLIWGCRAAHMHCVDRSWRCGREPRRGRTRRGQLGDDTAPRPLSGRSVHLRLTLGAWEGSDVHCTLYTRTGGVQEHWPPAHAPRRHRRALPPSCALDCHKRGPEWTTGPSGRRARVDGGPEWTTSARVDDGPEWTAGPRGPCATPQRVRQRPSRVYYIVHSGVQTMAIALCSAGLVGVPIVAARRQGARV